MQLPWALPSSPQTGLAFPVLGGSAGRLGEWRDAADVYPLFGHAPTGFPVFPPGRSGASHYVGAPGDYGIAGCCGPHLL